MTYLYITVFRVYNAGMKTSAEKRTELSVRRAELQAMGILAGCINTALVLVGIAFLIIRLSENMLDVFAIVLFSLAALTAIAGLCVAVAYRKAIDCAADGSENEHI